MSKLGKFLLTMGGLLVAATGIAVLRPSEATKGKPAVGVSALSATARVVAVQGAPDSVVTTASWTNPADDGKGPIDSAIVNFTGLGAGMIHQKIAVTATTATARQAIPLADATYSIIVQHCRYRAGKSACVQATAPDFSYQVAAPAPVSGLTVSNTRIP